MPTFRLANWRGKPQIIDNQNQPREIRIISMSTQYPNLQNGGVRPGAGRPAGSRGRRQKLTADFITAMGGADRITPLQRIEAERCASLTILLEQMRTRALSGEPVDPADLSRMESTWDRAVRRLNLPPPGSAAPVQTLQDYLASLEQAAAERTKAEG
jgi:hypothetical protein